MDASQTMRRALFSAVAAIVTTAASAQGEQSTAAQHVNDPIRELLSCSTFHIQDLDLARLKSVNGDASARSEMEDGLQSIRKCSSDALPLAIAEAGDNAALVEAVKTFYVKDAAYVGSVVSPGSRRVTERDRSEAWDRLVMEMKLAGK